MKVLTVGVFDYFHYGHLKLFQKARTFGDYLIVAVQRTEEIHKTKPDAKVLYSLEQRTEILKSLRCVDEVTVYSQIAEDIEKIDFDVFAVGEDQSHAGFQKAIAWCEQHNKQVVHMERTPNVCSSAIKNSIESTRN